MLLINILIAALGILAAQLINYLADVLPNTRSFSRPVCTNCTSFDSIRSYCFLNRCSSCNSKRPLRTWAVQIICPLVFLYFWIFPPSSIPYIGAVTLITYLGLVAIIDIEHRLILRPVTIAGLFIAGFLGTLLHGLFLTFVGGLAGMLIMLVLYYIGVGFVWLMNKYRDKETDEVALGFGDVSLSTVLGLLLGWPGITAGLTLAILLAGFFSGLYILFLLVSRRYSPLATIPYGPFLILGATILLFR